MRVAKVLTAWMLMCLVVAPPTTARKRPKAQEAQQTSPVTRVGGQSEKAQPAQSATQYVIGPEDVLEVNVWDEARFSRPVPVRPDGKISLPLLNDIQAAGLTPLQLAAVITEMLRKFVSQPQVTVTVTAATSQRVYILGEVARPGPTPLLPNMTILQAIASAGGISQFANQKRIYLLRTENGKQSRFPFNYKQAIREDTMKQNILLKPGDTIVVP